VYLKEDENTMGSQMLRRENSLESDEGDLHGEEGTSNIENAVGNIESGGHLSNNEQENLKSLKHTMTILTTKMGIMLIMNA
jgi:hypothetical protein